MRAETCRISLRKHCQRRRESMFDPTWMASDDCRTGELKTPVRHVTRAPRSPCRVGSQLIEIPAVLKARQKLGDE